MALLDNGAPIDDAEKSRLAQLIGIATVRLHTDRRLVESDKRHLAELVGLLSARLHEAAIVDRLATMQTQITELQREVAALQRQGATLS